MAVDGSFSGTPELIHNGTDTAEWTASALSGTWDFASTAQAQAGTKSVDATATVNNDEALFENGTTTNFGSYEGFSGYIYLTKYNTTRNQIQLRFRNAGVDVGNFINIGDSIDTGSLNVWQKFSINKSSFGIDLEIVDEMVCKTVTSSGFSPDYYLDTLQIEETGGKTFLIEPPNFNEFLITHFVFQITDALTSTVASGTMPGLSYNKILNLTELTSGISLIKTRKNEVAFNVLFKNISDFTFSGFVPISQLSDGTNTSVTLQLELTDPFIMQKKYNDKVILSFSEDLSGLLSFKALAKGKESISDN